MGPRHSTLIGIDWGTSHLRAFRIGSDGRILERRRNDCGIARRRGADFDAVLAQIIAGWTIGAPILMCGMIGSRQGWQEVPYQACPAGADALAQSLCPIPTSAGTAWIVAGLSTREESADAPGRPARVLHDVMRGEETLIVGAALSDADTLVVTPGTHSKWAMSHAGAILRFRTCMTGELYGLLRQHSILGRSLQIDSDPAGADQERAFLDGVQLALEERAVLHTLFRVRTQALFGQRPPPELSAYLSGILIGSEISGEARHVSREGPTIVIADPGLGRLYRLALAAAEFANVGFVDAEAAAAKGLWTLWQLRGT